MEVENQVGAEKLEEEGHVDEEVEREDKKVNVNIIIVLPSKFFFVLSVNYYSQNQCSVASNAAKAYSDCYFQQ